MAFEITQVVMQRVGEKRHIELVSDLYESMKLKLIRYARDEFQLNVADIRASARPRWPVFLNIELGVHRAHK